MKSEREERRNEEKNAKRGSRSVSDRGICSLESTCSSASPHISYEIDRFLSSSIRYLGHVSSNEISDLFAGRSLIPRDRHLPLVSTVLASYHLFVSSPSGFEPQDRCFASAALGRFLVSSRRDGVRSSILVRMLVSARPRPFCLRPPSLGTILIGSCRSFRATHTHPQT